jgi:prevent-host-death family protein
MSTVPLAEAQGKLQDLINEVSQSHEPILISGNTSNAFLVSEEDWKGVQETIYLLSIPEIGASIVEGLATPISECSETIDLFVRRSHQRKPLR